MQAWLVKETNDKVYITKISDIDAAVAKVQQHCQSNYRGWSPPIETADARYHASSYNAETETELSVIECDFSYFEDTYEYPVTADVPRCNTDWEASKEEFKNSLKR